MNWKPSILCVALLLYAAPGCRKRTAATPAAAPPPPAANPDPAAAPVAPSAYDAGSAADRQAASKDRLFKRWTAAFVRGTLEEKTKARAEIASQPPEIRAEFTRFCQANGVKTD